jgi:hypothetical protein
LNTSLAITGSKVEKGHQQKTDTSH